ncbi:MAG: VWA domain-containing protein [Nitrospirae bacterium]|nr:VWA domain-containing protein [Nitrospirota bacterium]
MKRFPILVLLITLHSSLFTIFPACENRKAPTLDPTEALEQLPQAEIASDPVALTPVVAWAVDQILVSLRYWDIVNVEEALDFTRARPGQPTLFAGLPLGMRPVRSRSRIARRQVDNSCPMRVDRSDGPTGKIDLELLGGCEASVSEIPIRYVGSIRLKGDLSLGGLRVNTVWKDWTEENPFGRKKVNGTQTLESSIQAEGEYAASIRRQLGGTTGDAGPIEEDFTWTVSGRDGEEANTSGSWLWTSGSSMSALRVDLRTTSVPADTATGKPERVTEGTLDLGLVGGGSLPVLSGSSSGRLTVHFESVRTGACRDGPAKPTTGRIIFESLNRVEAVFSDSCDGCVSLTDGSGRKVCWTEPAPPTEPPNPTEGPPTSEGVTEPPAEQLEAKIVVMEPIFTAQTDIASNQVTLASQDLAVALPEGYRTVNVEADVSGIFFDRSEGIRGFAVAGPSEAATASKLGEAFKNGSRINGTSLPAESAAVVSTVNSLRLTSVEGKPMSLQTFAVGFSSPRSWESVTAQLAAGVGMAAAKTEISMPGVEVGAASGVTSKDYIVALGSVARDGGKSLHAAAVAPMDRFDEQSSEMFQTVAAATRANAKLARKEESFTAQAQGPQITVSSSVVDVLWVIDDSGSMSEEQSNLATNFDAFFRQFRALNLDYHLGVVTTDCDSYNSTYYGSKPLCGALRKLSNGAVTIDSNTPQAEKEWATISRPGTSGSGNEKPLLAAREALTSRETDKTNAGFRRAGASLVVILVTDEVDHSYEGAYKNSDPGATYTPPTPFIQFVQAQAASVFAITGDPGVAAYSGGCTSANGGADPGNAVIEVAESTGGSWASICSSTFAPTLSLISQAIGTKSSRFRLSQAAIPSRIRVFVDGIEVRRSITRKNAGAIQQADGFIYDVASRTVSFIGVRFAPKPGQTVRVVYLAVEGLA